VTDPFDENVTQNNPIADPTPQAPTPAVTPLTLYRVDGRGRLNLSGVVADGIEFYSATKDPGGTITLVPVRVATTAVKRTTGEDAE